MQDTGACQPAVPASGSASYIMETEVVDMVVHKNCGGNDAFTVDCCTTAPSTTKQTLLPWSRFESNQSIFCGDTGGSNGSTLRTSRWVAMAAACNSATLAHPSRATDADGGVDAQVEYDGHVALPLLRLLTPVSAKPEVGQVALPLPLAMHLSPEIRAATADLVNKCLDRGYPFAALPTQHLAAVMAAAENDEGQLASSILTAHCVCYPGTGRHAVSSNGCPASEPACSSSSSGAGGSSGPKGSFGSVLNKAGASRAAEDATSEMRQLLSRGDALQVMSPVEYQRLQFAAERDLQQLRDILVAQQRTFAPEASGSLESPDSASGLVGSAGSCSRVVGQHRRGSSSRGETNFASTVVRLTFGLDGRAIPSLPASPVRSGGKVSDHDLHIPVTCKKGFASSQLLPF